MKHTLTKARQRPLQYNPNSHSKSWIPGKCGCDKKLHEILKVWLKDHTPSVHELCCFLFCNLFSWCLANWPGSWMLTGLWLCLLSCAPFSYSQSGHKSFCPCMVWQYSGWRKWARDRTGFWRLLKGIFSKINKFDGSWAVDFMPLTENFLSGKLLWLVLGVWTRFSWEEHESGRISSSCGSFPKSEMHPMVY
jgi:hypothetical protein